MTELDRRFGVVPRHSQEVTDAAGLLSIRDRVRLRRQLHLLQARFPQVRLSVFTCHVPNRPAQAYGFWVFNRCRFHEVGLKLGRCSSLLLLLNRADATVSLTGGYGLEGILSEEDLTAILGAGAASWKRQDYLEGILLLLIMLTKKLTAAHSRGAEIGTSMPMPDATLTL